MARRKYDVGVGEMLAFIIMLVVGAVALCVAGAKILWKFGEALWRRHRSGIPSSSAPPLPIAKATSVHRAEAGSPSVDEMRAGLQKVAYEMVGNRHDEETKARFKQGMTEFASLDPLVNEVVERARELVSTQPGILQSRIYAHFPDRSVEQVRYALYFAHELGWIHRKKKGNSYQLFPPGDLIDGKATPAP